MSIGPKYQTFVHQQVPFQLQTPPLTMTLWAPKWALADPTLDKAKRKP